MKKILLSAGLVCSLAFVFAQQKEEPKISYKEVGSTLPSLRIIDTLRNEYTEQSFKNNNHFFLFLFNPTCGHCIQMAKEIGDHSEEFKNNHILFMAGPAMLPYMASFYQSTGIGNHPEIKVGVDSASAVDKLFNYHMLPQVNIYDKNRKLVKIFYGDVKLDSLKKYVP